MKDVYQKEVNGQVTTSKLFPIATHPLTKIAAGTAALGTAGLSGYNYMNQPQKIEDE